jgi:hypothetical protein
MMEHVISFRPVFLWDESKRLAGRLELTSDMLNFYADSFKDSELGISILLKRMTSVKLYRLYDLVASGVEISDNEGRKYIFIMQDPKRLSSLLQTRINST